LAERYKDNPYVMFGLFNEPFWGSQDLINTFGWTPRTAQLNIDYARYCESIIDAIHSVSNKIVFVDRPYVWGYATNSPEPVNRDNIVWEARAQDVGGEVSELGSGEAGSKLLQKTLHNADGRRNKHS
jgi:hypothetical protein